MTKRQDLSSTMRASFDALNVPAFDKTAVRDRATRQKDRQVITSRPRRRVGLVMGLLFLVPVLALAFSSRGALETAISARLHSEGVTAPIHYYEAKRISLVEAKAHAPFRIVLPSGLPQGYISKGIFQSQPGVYTVTYSKGTANLTVEIQKNSPHGYVRVGNVKFETNAQGQITKEVRVRSRAWKVGNEILLLSSADLSDAQFKRIKIATGARDEIKPKKDALRSMIKQTGPSIWPHSWTTQKGSENAARAHGTN